MTLLGCGSSYYAACASHHFFKLLKTFKKINIVDPVELCEDDIIEGETVVMISQSGETKDLINIVESCKTQPNVKTIGIINVEGSTLARKTDFPIYIKVGREVAVAATKSYFHQALNLIQFATEVAEQKRSASYEVITCIREELLSMPEMVQKTIDLTEEKCAELAKLIYKKESIYLLAKRESLAIAKEAALKIKELNYIHAEALGACEMKHGPIALIESEKKA
jgi:glutamine---fructose-6-phosphate transaminase (isomerizing)